MLTQKPSKTSKSLTYLTIIGAMLFGFLCGALIWYGYYINTLLVIALACLFYRLKQHEQQTRSLAQRIRDRQTNKFEVQQGAWGELSRAVNGLMQEQRISQHVQSIQPQAIPNNALQALLGGNIELDNQSRIVSVLLVGNPHLNEKNPDLHAWQTLGEICYSTAQNFNAVLQPCGNALLLAFGCFEEQSIQEMLSAASASIEQINQQWQQAGYKESLSHNLCQGAITPTLLPGLGYSLCGAPINEVVRLWQLRQSGISLGEGVSLTSTGKQAHVLYLPARHRAAPHSFGS